MRRHLILAVSFLAGVLYIIGVIQPAQAATNTVMLRPNSTLSAGWTAVGTSNGDCTGNCGQVNESSISPDIGNIITSSSGNITPITDEYGLEDTTAGQTATTVTVRAYVMRQSTLGSPKFELNLRIGGVLQTPSTGPIVSTAGVYGWVEAAYTGEWSQSDLNGASMIVTRIGGLLAAGYRVATVETTATIESPAQNQSVARISANENSKSPGVALAATNTAADVSQGSAFRLRAGIAVSGIAWRPGAWGAHNNLYRLQYATKTAGTCSTQTTGWGDVTSSSDISWYDNTASGVTDGAGILSSSSDPDTSGAPKVYQTYEEANTFTVINPVPVGSVAIWDFSLKNNAPAIGNSYCFKIIKDDGTALDTYGTSPEIITTGSLSVDIVDSGGASVSSPNVLFATRTASLACQTSTGTLGTSSQKLRINNDVAAGGWSTSIAATYGPTTLWSTLGADQYDFNDSGGSPAGCGDGADGDTKGGRLRVRPSLAPSLTSGCATTGVSKGTDAYFSEGSVDSITLATATSATPRFCYFDMTGIGLEQQIPSSTPVGNYSLDFTLTVLAS